MMETIFSARVMTERVYFVKCPRCKHEHEVDKHMAETITCKCGLMIKYDNRDPIKADRV